MHLQVHSGTVRFSEWADVFDGTARYEERFMKRQTPQRVAIEAAFASAGRPLGSQKVLDAAREQVPSLNLTTATAR